MDHSPGYMSSQQVPVIGWNMESPHTGPAVPRSRIILPKIVSTPEGSPAGRFIKSWGKCGRKRKIRKSTQRDVTETPNKESEGEFDFSDDELLSQVNLDDTSPPRPQSSALKTPTSLQKQHVIAMPRKLTVEFDSEDDEWGEDDLLLLEGAEMADQRFEPVQACNPVPSYNPVQACNPVPSYNPVPPCNPVPRSHQQQPSIPAPHNKALVVSTTVDMSDNSVLDLLKDVDFSDFSDDDDLDEDLAFLAMQEDIDTPRRKNKTLSLRKP